VAFIVDVYSRMIVGWRATTTMTTDLVLDTLEHAIWTRRQAGVVDLSGLVHHTDAGSQYTSFAFTSRLIEAGVDPSVGSVGDAYDNALAESQIGTCRHGHAVGVEADHALPDALQATLTHVDDLPFLAAVTAPSAGSAPPHHQTPLLSLDRRRSPTPREPHSERSQPRP
jgi:transposase InsO family protein